MSNGRRATGSLRMLPSGRVQVRYTGLDGIRRTAPQTFPTKTLARRWLASVEADMVRGVWRNPDAGIGALRSYAVRWVVERDLSERTRELYRGLLDRQILPFIGDLDLLAITPARVRSWRRDLISTGVGASTVAKAYRLLRALLNTAADDEVIVRTVPHQGRRSGVDAGTARNRAR